MGEQTSRRQLGRRLKDIREQLGIRQEAAADALDGISRTTFWRIETGRVAVKDGTILELARYYRCDGKTTDELLAMAHATRSEDNDAAFGKWVNQYLDLERRTRRLAQWHSWLVQPLLQTESYARAVVASDTADQEVIETRLRTRRQRQEHALGRTDRRIDLVLADAVFTQLNIGDDILKRQYDYLVQASQMDGISIRILTPDVGLHPGIRGPFSLLDFEDELDPSVVFLEHLTGARYLDKSEHVEPYRSAFLRLQELSVPIEEHEGL